MKKDPTTNKNQLGNLLLRYKQRLKPPQASVEKEAAETIAQVTGITISAQQITYTPSSRTLVLKTPSVVRSEVLFKKTEILKILKNNLGADSAPTTII